MTHILLTNDDGVRSPGLLAARQALEAAGMRVSVIAPDGNRSAIGRGITTRQALSIEEVELADGSRAHATDGTPVDCVRLAALGLLDGTPEVIVSGINLGLNLGDDVTYSGTVAAALEGVLLGWPAVAISADTLPGRDGQPEAGGYDFRAVAAFAARLVPVAARERFPRKVVLNVNGPGLPPERVRGARVTKLGRRVYNDELQLVSEEGGRRSYRIYGPGAGFEEEEGTDFAAVENGEISVTPLHFDLTDVAGMGLLERMSLRELLEASPASVET